MYDRIKPRKTTIRVNKQYKGETIEQKMRRVLTNKEPIKDGAPLLYGDRSEGVRAHANIKTDKLELALEARDKISKSIRGKRAGTGKLGEEAKKNMEKEAKTETKNDGKPESTQGTNTTE